MYRGHPSTFEPALRLICGVTDATDVDASISLKAAITGVLTDRFREEVDGGADGPFAIGYATDRIHGLVHGGSGRPGLQSLRDRAAKAGACAEFLEVIDLVLAEARAAFGVALNRPLPAVEAEKPSIQLPGWAKTPLGNPEMIERPDFSDI